MKKMLQSIAIILMLVFNMTLPAFAAQGSQPVGEKTVLAAESFQTESLPDRIVNKSVKATLTRMEVNKISLQPIYQVNGVVCYGEGYKKTRSYSAWPQSLLMLLTTAEKEAMDKKVTDAGHVITGYHVEVVVDFSGDYQNGYIQTTEPAGMSNIRVRSEYDQIIIPFDTSADTTYFNWQAGFFYFRPGVGKQLSQSIGASWNVVDPE